MITLIPFSFPFKFFTQNSGLHIILSKNSLLSLTYTQTCVYSYLSLSSLLSLCAYSASPGHLLSQYSLCPCYPTVFTEHFSLCSSLQNSSLWEFCEYVYSGMPCRAMYVSVQWQFEMISPAVLMIYYYYLLSLTSLPFS
jgi:hypothetical protein